MRQVLFATTALVLSAGVAAADVTISGSARAGITYDSAPGVGTSKTQVDSRLRFNFDASKELDSGVTLGGRIRLQSDANRAERQATLNQAGLYAEFSGFRVEVGNVETAFDNMATLYNAELGYIGTVQGSYGFASYASYESRSYAVGEENRMGVAVFYTVGDLTARLSYVTPNQATTGAVDEELAASFDYTVGQFSFGAGVAMNGGFIDNNDVYAVTGEYALNDTTAVGLQYIDNGEIAAVDQGRTITLYGRTSVGNGIGLGAFVSNINNDALLASGSTKKTSYGIGFDYDLGGATLAGTVQRTHSSTTYADLGIRFAF